MANGRWTTARNRSNLLHGLLIVGTCVLLGLFLPPTAFVASAGAPGIGSSGLTTFMATPPRVTSQVSLVVTGASATSTPFGSLAGDTIVVFVSVYGASLVAVSDSSHDVFSSLKVIHAPPASAGHASLEIFSNSNVSGGASTRVTVSLSGPSPLSAAADIVDVNGVGPASPTLGTPENYSNARGPADSDTVVTASTSDLVLAGVAADHTHDWKATGGDTLLDDTHQPASGASVTAADFSAVASSNGKVWVNSTSTSNTTYWVSDAIALHPYASTTTFAVTFSETGLPTSQTWYASMGGQVNSAKAPKSFALSEPNGSYRFTIGAISGFIASPATGLVTIAGAARTEAISFGPDTSNWTTYLGGVARNAATTHETTLSTANAQNLSLLWTAYTGHVQSEPAVLNGVVYAGAINGYEYAVNASTGATIWKTFIGQVTQPNCDPGATGITSSATVSGGMVYVGGGNITGNLTNGIAGWYALNATTGAIAWNIPIGNAGLGYYNWASPLIADGNAYIGVASRCDEPLVWGGVLQVSLTTHAVLGFFNTTVGGGNTRGSSVWGSPSFDQSNNTIFFATGNPFKVHTTNYSESVVAINATTLAPVGTWQIPASQVANVSDADFGTTPDYFHLPNGTPMVSSLNKNGRLYVLNPTHLSTGPVWQSYVTNSEDPPGVDPAAYGGGLLYEGGGATTLSGVAVNGSIRAYYPGNGTVKWHLAMDADVLGAPIYSNGVLVVSGGRELDVLNASTGALLWNWTCKSWFESAATVAEGRIFVGCHNLYAFGFTGKPVDGNQIAANPYAALPRPAHSAVPFEVLGSPGLPPAAFPERVLARAPQHGA
jgi:outer membrane protein assembly factor BamB